MLATNISNIFTTKSRNKSYSRLYISSGNYSKSTLVLLIIFFDLGSTSISRYSSYTTKNRLFIRFNINFIILNVNLIN